ncbi:hypothetical protein HaLaN_18990 [Haematococcus lacustris]|uniref:Uncharacterized protein n=1 Tax=Haematococcus lacustris TaxID=44745 RepID=A0A699ZHD8_HAELA|nr:hypothetical protein HaLaN_18990 [Haematococcus lacustris]
MLPAARVQHPSCPSCQLLLCLAASPDQDMLLARLAVLRLPAESEKLTPAQVLCVSGPCILMHLGVLLVPQGAAGADH